MSEKKGSLAQKRAHKKKINRIKTGIVVMITAIAMICLITCVFLLFRVHSLQTQLDILTENILITIDDSVKAAEGAVGSAGEIFEGEDQTGMSDDELSLELEISDLLLEKVRDHVDPAENLYSEGDTRRVFLTFDDGPSGNTGKILDILDQYGIKATFFVNGRDTEAMRKLYAEIVNRGHTIGMHSYTHNYLSVYESLKSFADDYNRIYDLIVDAAGVEPGFYRFPGGSSNSVSGVDMDELIRFLGARGIVYYDWNVVSGDATTQAYTSEDLVNNVINGVTKYKDSVVLMHDATEKVRTVEALPGIIDGLLEMDCEILPITDSSPVIHH